MVLQDDVTHVGEPIVGEILEFRKKVTVPLLEASDLGIDFCRMGADFPLS